MPSSVLSTYLKATNPKATWPDKEEFLDVIYWGRQILAVILGLIWGILALKGALSILTFAAVNAGLVFLYCSQFQSIDQDEFGGPWEIVKEGFVTSLSTFLVVWIATYTAFTSSSI